MHLDEKVALLSRVLAEADVPHAFGGAIALAYYATPRGTVDVDINVFLPATAFDRVLEVLLPVGVEPPSPALRRTLERDEQVRLVWDGTPVDLFFSYNELHDACLARTRKVPFGSERIVILSPEDLATFKTLFARDKDWRDLREMLLAQGPSFDVGYVVAWLERILAQDDERLGRFRELVAERPEPNPRRQR
jgi:hypothetical protein